MLFYHGGWLTETKAKQFAALAVTAAVFGLGTGQLFQVSLATEAPPGWSAPQTVGGEDPNVTLYQTVMGAEPRTAPQPYVRYIAEQSEATQWTDDSIYDTAWSGLVEEPASTETAVAAPAPSISLPTEHVVPDVMLVAALQAPEPVLP